MIVSSSSSVLSQISLPVELHELVHYISYGHFLELLKSGVNELQHHVTSVGSTDLVYVEENVLINFYYLRYKILVNQFLFQVNIF